MPKHIEIDLSSQTLTLFSGMRTKLRTFSISSARNGWGETAGSYCTPRGLHVIRAKIGAGAPLNAVFCGRRPTGEVYSAGLAMVQPGRDWILTRILWLSGQQLGFNRGGNVDSMRRYVYIHGTPDSEPMGEPASHGCIRMRNVDVAELFDLVECGSGVNIVAASSKPVSYPLPERVDLQAMGLQPLTGPVAISPVTAPAFVRQGWWSPHGELLAAGRLFPGGNIALWGLLTEPLPVELLYLLRDRAVQAGWLSIRLLARETDVQQWLQLAGEVVSDPVEIDGQRYRALRWYTAAD